MTSPAFKNGLPPGLVSNLQQVLKSRKPHDEGKDDDLARPSSSGDGNDELDGSKPIILVTNSDGVESPGLASLVDALVREGSYNVHVVAPQSSWMISWSRDCRDKSMSGHSVSVKESVEVTSVEINGATAFEVSGTPVDCVSLSLSGALFSWSKPLLVISGINKGSSCGHHMFYSGVVAGAREALINGVPSISISLNWRKDVSEENDLKDAVTVSLPIVNAIIRDVEKGVFPKGFFLDVEIPTSPLANKGIKVTERSLWRSTLNWQAVSGIRNQSASRFSGGQVGIGMQFAQLSRDASAAGAARRLTTQKKDIEVVESVGAAGKSEFKRTVKYFRAEMVDKEHIEQDEYLDFRAVENGFVSITPLSPSLHLDSETKTAALDWISSALLSGQ